MKLRSLIPAACLAAAACLAEAPSTGPAPTQPPAPTSEFRVHLLPPGAYEHLNFTPDQAKAVTALEIQTSAALSSILTADQLSQLKHPKGRHGGHPKGPGGPAGGQVPPPPPGN